MPATEKEPEKLGMGMWLEQGTHIELGRLFEQLQQHLKESAKAFCGTLWCQEKKEQLPETGIPACSLRCDYEQSQPFSPSVK